MVNCELDQLKQKRWENLSLSMTNKIEINDIGKKIASQHKKKGKRIVQDINRVVDYAYLRIFEAQGIVVPHIGTRRGQRNDLSTGQLPHGGWIHPDARIAYIFKNLRKLQVYLQNYDNIQKTILVFALTLYCKA